MDLVWNTARGIGLGSTLSHIRAPVGDDHLPFLDVGISRVDIVDFNFGTPKPTRSTRSVPAAWIMQAGLCSPCLKSSRNRIAADYIDFNL